MKHPEVYITLAIRPDTLDEVEARQDALDFIANSTEGWYSSIRLIGPIVVEWVEVD